MLNRWQPFVAAGFALLAVACTAGMMQGRATSDLLFYVSALAQSVVAAAAGWFGARARGRATVLLLAGAALALRAFLIFEPPSLSTDVYRYIWDGKVVNAGVNPYTHIPDDPTLAYLRDPDIFPNITRRDYAVTIYPPVAEGFFALVTRVSASLTAMKLAMTLAEGVAVLALLRLLKDLGRSRGLVFGYLLHPAPLWEIAGNGHVDALAMALLYSAFAWGGGAARPFISGALLTFGALAKPAAALGLPGVWRPFQIALPVFVVALGLGCYAPFLGAGKGVMGFLPIFVHERGMDTGDGFYWIALIEHFGSRPQGAAPIYYAFSGVLFLSLALASRWRAGLDVRASLLTTGRLLVAALLILTPGLPWYFLMALPMTAVVGWSAPVAMSSVAFLLYDFDYDFAGDAPPFFARWSVAVGVGAAAALADALRAPGEGVRS